MTAEQIMHALRQTAMSRINTPEQQELCEKLAALFVPVGGWQPVSESVPSDGAIAAKRTRKPKAD